MSETWYKIIEANVDSNSPDLCAVLFMSFHLVCRESDTSLVKSTKLILLNNIKH